MDDQRPSGSKQEDDERAAPRAMAVENEPEAMVVDNGEELMGAEGGAGPMIMAAGPMVVDQLPGPSAEQESVSSSEIGTISSADSFYREQAAYHTVEDDSSGHTFQPLRLTSASTDLQIELANQPELFAHPDDPRPASPGGSRFFRGGHRADTRRLPFLSRPLRVVRAPLEVPRVEAGNVMGEARVFGRRISLPRARAQRLARPQGDSSSDSSDVPEGMSSSEATEWPSSSSTSRHTSDEEDNNGDGDNKNVPPAAQ